MDQSGFADKYGWHFLAQIHDSCDVARLVMSSHQVLAASEEVSVPRFESRIRESEDQRPDVTLLIFAPLAVTSPEISVLVMSKACMSPVLHSTKASQQSVGRLAF